MLILVTYFKMVDGYSKHCTAFVPNLRHTSPLKNVLEDYGLAVNSSQAWIIYAFLVHDIIASGTFVEYVDITFF